MTLAPPHDGRVFVIAGPSGSGKTTIYKRLLKEEPGINFSVSATTRPPRQGEVDGQDYHFLSREEFLRRREAGDFVEWAEVHGNYYGTCMTNSGKKRPAAGYVCWMSMSRGRQPAERGAGRRFHLHRPPSLEILEERLRTRGTGMKRRSRSASKTPRKNLQQPNNLIMLLSMTGLTGIRGGSRPDHQGPPATGLFYLILPR